MLIAFGIYLLVSASVAFGWMLRGYYVRRMNPSLTAADELEEHNYWVESVRKSVERQKS